MLDDLMTSFFTPTIDYGALSDAVKTTLNEQYLIISDTVVASTVSKKYWSNIWDELRPCVITETGLLPAENFTFDHATMYTILRPKELLSEILDEEKIIMRSMASPSITIDFYQGFNPIALDGRQSAIPTETPKGFVEVRKTATYQFEDLEPIQLDYVSELFTTVWQQVYDEQEENYDENELKKGRGPISGLFGQFVAAMTFERHKDQCFITFHFQVYDKTANKNTVKETELPVEIEIMTSIPLAEDDDVELTPEDMNYITLDEDGEHAVQFSVTASLYVI